MEDVKNDLLLSLVSQTLYTQDHCDDGNGSSSDGTFLSKVFDQTLGTAAVDIKSSPEYKQNLLVTGNVFDDGKLYPTLSLPDHGEVYSEEPIIDQSYQEYQRQYKEQEEYQESDCLVKQESVAGGETPSEILSMMASDDPIFIMLGDGPAIKVTRDGLQQLLQLLGDTAGVITTVEDVTPTTSNNLITPSTTHNLIIPSPTHNLITPSTILPDINNLQEPLARTVLPPNSRHKPHKTVIENRLKQQQQQHPAIKQEHSQSTSPSQPTTTTTTLQHRNYLYSQDYPAARTKPVHIATEQFSNEQLWPEQFLPGQLSSGQLLTGQLSFGQLSPGQFPFKQVSPGQLSSKQMSPGELSSKQLLPGQLSHGPMSPGQLPFGQLSPAQLSSSGQLSPNPLLRGQLSPGQLSSGQLSPEQLSPRQLSLLSSQPHHDLLQYYNLHQYPTPGTEYKPPTTPLPTTPYPGHGVGTTLVMRKPQQRKAATPYKSHKSLGGLGRQRYGEPGDDHAVQRCPLCGEKAGTKNPYRRLQDHLARRHFWERLQSELPKEKPYPCPEPECGGKAHTDWQAVMRHYIGHKHGKLDMYVNEELIAEDKFLQS